MENRKTLEKSKIINIIPPSVKKSILYTASGAVVVALPGAVTTPPITLGILLDASSESRLSSIPVCQGSTGKWTHSWMALPLIASISAGTFRFEESMADFDKSQ